MSPALNFGYPWWLSYGHLVVFALFASLLLLAFARRSSKVLKAFLGLGVLWSGAAFVATRTFLDVNGRAGLPTQHFLQSGRGRVLDMGAGTGRSSIMVLEARPQATLVALDLFGDSFERHFGRSQPPQERLLTNLKIAGVERRATVATGDMRALPFPAGDFDAVVSAYAVDHLNREGIHKSLSEAARVLKPGGEFLLILIGKDPWLKFTFGPLLLHNGTRGADWWSGRLAECGFQVAEQGTRPGTLYLLAHTSNAQKTTGT